MFLIGAFFFLAVQAISLLVGHSILSQYTISAAPVGSSIASFLVAFLFATGVLLVLLKFFKGGMLFKLMISFIVLVGAETVFGVFLPEVVALLIAIEFILIRYLVPNIFVQNTVLVIAIAGIGATLGVMLPTIAVIVILIVLSIYDFIAVYKTKHMVTMFKGMMNRGVSLALVIPDTPPDITAHVSDARPPKPGEKRSFMMLGTGDVAFPAIFAVSALRTSMMASLAVVVGALVGLLIVHLILMRKKHGAIPALPPIAICSILSFILLEVITRWIL